MKETLKPKSMRLRTALSHIPKEKKESPQRKARISSENSDMDHTLLNRLSKGIFTFHHQGDLSEAEALKIMILILKKPPEYRRIPIHESFLLIINFNLPFFRKGRYSSLSPSPSKSRVFQN
jgi:hypothetical protein